MGAHFEAIDKGVLQVPLDPRYTQVRFNLVSVQVWPSNCVCVCVCVFKFLLKQSIMLLSPPLKPKEIQLREKRCYEPGKHPP